jgi:hypothetical protein
MTSNVEEKIVVTLLDGLAMLKKMTSHEVGCWDNKKHIFRGMMG